MHLRTLKIIIVLALTYDLLQAICNSLHYKMEAMPVKIQSTNDTLLHDYRTSI